MTRSESYEITEASPDDKYLPSFLVLARQDTAAVHILFATDVAGNNVRVVTADQPEPREWEPDLKKIAMRCRVCGGEI